MRLLEWEVEEFLEQLLDGTQNMPRNPLEDDDEELMDMVVGAASVRREDSLVRSAARSSGAADGNSPRDRQGQSGRHIRVYASDRAILEWRREAEATRIAGRPSARRGSIGVRMSWSVARGLYDLKLANKSLKISPLQNAQQLETCNPFAIFRKQTTLIRRCSRCSSNANLMT